MQTTNVLTGQVVVVAGAGRGIGRARGSHLPGVLPCREADTDISVTENETVIPPYLERVLIELEPGDVVFFGGLTIHGSLPNRSADRFRRAFICRYEGETAYPIAGPHMPADAEHK